MPFYLFCIIIRSRAKEWSVTKRTKQPTLRLNESTKKSWWVVSVSSVTPCLRAFLQLTEREGMSKSLALYIHRWLMESSPFTPHTITSIITSDLTLGLLMRYLTRLAPRCRASRPCCLEARLFFRRLLAFRASDVQYCECRLDFRSSQGRRFSVSVKKQAFIFQYFFVSQIFFVVFKFVGLNETLQFVSNQKTVHWRDVNPLIGTVVCGHPTIVAPTLLCSRGNEGKAEKKEKF